MKKLFALLTALVLLPIGSLSLAEEDLDIEEFLEEEMPAGENDAEYILDEDTGETFVLTTESQAKVDELDDEVDDSVDPDTLELNPNLPDNVVNILLVGVDTRSKDPEEILGRGDTQIILSVNKDTGRITMVSILRDSFVTIPGYKNKNKINNSFQFGCNKKDANGKALGTSGGAQLSMRTVNHNFDMNIKYCLAINFNGLASIIDALGGIDIDVTRAEANYINSYLRKNPPAYDNKAKGERVKLDWDAVKESGEQEVVDKKLFLHMDGVQAVMYARIRSLNGESDFNRTDRQRHLLDLLLQNVITDMNLDRVIDLLDAFLPYAWTNMNAMDMLDLASAVLRSDILSRVGSGSLMDQMRVPMNKTYSYKTINGSSVLSFKAEKQATAIHEFIYGTYYPAE